MLPTNNRRTKPDTRRIVLTNSNMDNEDDEDTKYNPVSNTDQSPTQLRQYAPRPVSCNGDCGSQFAKMIHNITHLHKRKLDITEEQIIAHKFWLPDSPLRQTLIKQIENQPILNNDEKYKEMLKTLKDKNCYIQGTEWCKRMLLFLEMLYKQQYVHILHALSNETCLVPDSRSLFGEYAAYHKRQRDQWQDELNRINVKLLDCIYSSTQQKDIDVKKRIDLQQKIAKWNPKSWNDEQTDLKRFETRLEEIKQTPEYKQMYARNMHLTDTEIYAVMVYCEENQNTPVYSEFHKSQRETDKFNVSCEWKTLFYHLCCAVYKIREIFHRKNRDFKRQWISGRASYDDKLYRGIPEYQSISDKHISHTISSFTHSSSIAVDFTHGHGMILVIPAAFRAIHNGTLMAADVSWISEFGESEFLVAPIVFNKIERVYNDPNSSDYHIAHPRMDWDKIYLFEISDFKSETLDTIQYRVSQRIQDPLTALEAMLPIKNTHTSQIITVSLLLGTFGKNVCRSCHVQFRLCEVATSLLGGNIECPACRALFAQYPQLSDNTIAPDTFECYYLDCPKKWIHHTDLVRVEEKRHLGYKCRYCSKQQRQALSDRYTKTSQMQPEYLEIVSEQFIYHIEEAVKEINDDKQPLTLSEDKEEFIKLLSFIMDIERAEKNETGNVWFECPIIWKWIAQFDGVKKGLDVLIKNILTKEANIISHKVEEVKDNSDVRPIMNQIGDIVQETTGKSVDELLQNPDSLQKEVENLKQFANKLGFKIP